MELTLSAWRGSHYALTARGPLPRKETSGRALRDVLIANYEKLSRQLALRLGCPDLARDCLHDAWLRLGDITLSPAIQRPDAYILRVACNLAFNRLRGSRPEQLAEDADVDMEHFADAGPGLEDVAEAQADLDAVNLAFQRLPPRHQSVLIALRIEEQTREEVAARLRLSLRNVDTTLRQALQHCVAQTGRSIAAGSSRPRRALPSRWRRPVNCHWTATTHR